MRDGNRNLKLPILCILAVLLISSGATRLAGAKQESSGWGRVFKQLQTEGLIQERKLGRLTGRHR